MSNQKDGLACSEKRNNATPNGTIAVKPTNGDGNILKECVQPPRAIFVNEATPGAPDCSHEGECWNISELPTSPHQLKLLG